MPPVVATQPEDGIVPWQQEFGSDPTEALTRMDPSDPRFDEVKAWADAEAQRAEPAAQQEVSPGLIPEEPVLPISKAERAKQRAEKRAQEKQAKQAALEEERIRDYAATQDYESAAHRADVTHHLRQLVSNPDRYRQLYDALPLHMRNRLGQAWHPDTAFAPTEIAPPAPQAAPRKGKRPLPGRKQPPKVAKRPRPVSLTMVKEEAKPVPTAKTGKITVRVTPELHARRARETTEEQAQARLVRTTVRHAKTRRRLGTVADIVRVTPEKPAPTTREVKPVTIQGKVYNNADEIDATIKKLRAKKLPSKSPAARMLQGLEAFKFTQHREISPDYERMVETVAPEPVAEALPETRFKLSFKKEPVTLEDLLTKYHVETAATEERLPEGAVEAATKVDPVAAVAKRLAQHFKVAKAKPVLLSSLGMAPEQVTALENAGLAEDGSMDASEFGRWDASLRGAEAPPRTTPYVERELPKKKTFFQPKPKPKPPTPKQAETARRAEVRELHYEAGERLKERHAAAPVETQQRPKTEPLRQQVEAGLQARITRELTKVGEFEPEVFAGDVLAAAEQAVAGVKPGAKDSPFALAQRRLERVIDDAVAAYKAGVTSRDEFALKTLEAKAATEEQWRTVWSAIKKKAERLGKKKSFKHSSAIAGEARGTQRNRAREEAAKKRNKEPHDEILAQMHPLFRQAAAFSKNPALKGEFDAVNAKIEKLQARRVVVAKAVEARALDAATRDALALQAAERREHRKLEAYLQRQVEKGLLDKELAKQLASQENEKKAEQYRKKIEREKKFGPTLRTIIAAAKPPKPPREVQPGQKAKRFSKVARTKFLNRLEARVLPELGKVPHLPASYVRQSREFVYRFVMNAQRAMRKAGVVIPTRLNRNTNTPEENGLIFAAQMYASRARPMATRIVSKETKQYAKRMKKLGNISTRGPSATVEAGGRDKTRAITNIHDATTAMMFMQNMADAKAALAATRNPLQREDLRQQIDLAEQRLYGVIFDSAQEEQLPAWVPEIFGEAPEVAGKLANVIAAAEEETTGSFAELERIQENLAAEARAFKEAKTESEKSAALKAKMEMARVLSGGNFRVVVNDETGKSKVVYESPVTLPEDAVSPAAMAERPTGRVVESMLGRDALDRWTAKWKVLEGAPRGWRRWVRGAMIRNLRQLVGDIDVHVVDGAYTDNKAGIFVPGDNPQILINSAALDRPGILADTIIHEMGHAATNYALRNNIRGTRDVVDELMRQLHRQLFPNNIGMPAAFQHAFKNADEFVAAGIENGAFQDLLASLSPNIAAQAQVRALGKGRAMPTYWDKFVSMVENAIGFFTPDGHGGSYMSQLLRIYPNVAMTLSEQARHAREQGGAAPNANDILEFPLDIQSLKSAVSHAFSSNATAGSVVRKNLPTEELRRVNAEDFFEGKFENPAKDLFDMLEQHPRLVEDKMDAGNVQDTDIVRHANENRAVNEPAFEKAYDILTQSVTNDVDVTRDIAANKWIRDDAAHPLTGGKVRTQPTTAHVRDTGKRSAHAAGRAKWLALPQQIRDLMSKRLAHMSAQMAEHEQRFTENWIKMLVEQPDHPLVLPPGMSQADAAAEIMAGKITDPLKAALGRDNFDTVKKFGRLTRQGRLYAPLFRAGRYFISGRRDIPLPTVTHGSVSIDQQLLKDSDRFEFIFTDKQGMQDYLDSIGTSGDELPIGKARTIYISTLTGQPVTSSKPEVKGKKSYPPKVEYRVPMQHRFMAMSDSLNELKTQQKDLTGSGEYKFISDPVELSQKTTLAGAMPLKLEKMLNNIDSQSGRSPHEKAVMKQMATAMFAQTQQGNRITKHLMKRTSVHGYDVSFEAMRKAFRTNNEMMSRHNVALDRMPKIKAAESYMDKYVDALARRHDPSGTALSKLTAEDQAVISRNMGKYTDDSARRLQADVKAVKDRIEGAMLPQGRVVGEDVKRAFFTTVTMSYLMGPSYSLLQTASIPMFTLPRMIAEIAKSDGALAAGGRAGRYLYAAGQEVGFMSHLGSGLVETLMEAGRFAKGFDFRREGFLEHARTVEPARNYLPALYDRLRANGSAEADEVVDMLETARKMNFIGQAGLNQANLQENILGGGVKNKMLRGIMAGGKVFSAYQEAAEINNRAVPMIAYYRHFRDIGDSPAEAKAKAINRMTSEQVGYSKENWPAWVTNSWLGGAMMFKKFAAQQAINYYGSLLRSFNGATPEERRYARVHIVTSTLMMVALGGFVGNPLWEPFRLLLYLMNMFGFDEDPLLGLPTGDWNAAKTQGEKWLAGLVGGQLAEDLVYGATRELGIDLSGRIAQDSLLFFKQPTDMTQDEWYTVLGRTVGGAPAQTVLDAGSAIAGLTDPNVGWNKEISKLPIPKVIKDMFKAYDLMENGPATTTGVKTGEPAGLPAAILQSLGLRSRAQARPFEQGSAAQHKIEQDIDAKRTGVMQTIINSGYGADSARRVRDWNRSHPGKEERITMKNLHDARKRRRKLELEIRRKNLEAA